MLMRKSVSLTGGIYEREIWGCVRGAPKSYSQRASGPEINSCQRGHLAELDSFCSLPSVFKYDKLVNSVMAVTCLLSLHL